jgi:hypothetical protein
LKIRYEKCKYCGQIIKSKYTKRDIIKKEGYVCKECRQKKWDEKKNMNEDENKMCKCCKHVKCICNNEQKKEPIVCKNLYGNILLHDKVKSLDIWQNRTKMCVTATISVFNSNMSMGSLLVFVIQKGGHTVEFTVPSGNTISALVDNIESILVIKSGQGRIEGKFCIDVCLPIFCHEQCKYPFTPNDYC